MEGRRIPGTDRPLSVLGISVGPWVLGRAPGDRVRRLQALIEGALGRGILLFDLRAGAETPRVEEAVGPILASHRSEVTLLSELTAPAGSGRSGRSSSDWPLRAESSRARLGGAPADLLTVTEREAAEPEAMAEIEKLARGGEIGPWGIRRLEERGDGPIRPGPEPMDSTACVLDLTYNLIHPDPGRSLIDRWHRAGRAILVHDVHAAGRLDGGWLGPGPMDPRRPPVPLADLRREFAPVLALAGARGAAAEPLPVAALRFALAPAGVAAALVAPATLVDLDAWIAALVPTADRAPPIPPPVSTSPTTGRPPMGRPDRDSGRG